MTAELRTAGAPKPRRLDDRTGARFALAASALTIPIASFAAAGWIARGYESLAAVAVLCLGLAIVSAGFALVLRRRS